MLDAPPTYRSVLPRDLGITPWVTLALGITESGGPGGGAYTVAERRVLPPLPYVLACALSSGGMGFSPFSRSGVTVRLLSAYDLPVWAATWLAWQGYLIGWGGDLHPLRLSCQYVAWPYAAYHGPSMCTAPPSTAHTRLVSPPIK